MSDAAPCAIDGCPRNAAPRRRWCWTHLRRMTRGTPALSAPIGPQGGYATPWERVVAAALALAEADAEDDAEWARASARLRAAMHAYCRRGVSGD